MQTLLGKKQTQTQKFLQNGRRIPVTQIAVPDNAVVQVKTQAKDNYTSIQIGFGTRKKPTKPQIGHAQKAGLGTTAVPQVIKEVRLIDIPEDQIPQPGSLLSLDQIFKLGDIVDVTGVSKGKGFAGAVKRYHFRGGPKTHGQSDRHRAPGSIGAGTTPGRVYRGKKMAGHMGAEQVTIKNLKIVDIDPVNKLLSVMGLIPGGKNTIVCIHRTGEMKNFTPLHKIEVEPTPEAPNQEAPQSISEPTKVETEEIKTENPKEGEKQEATK